MNMVSWLQELDKCRRVGVKVFTIGELMNISNTGYDTARRTIVRLKGKGILRPVYRGLWGYGDDITLEDIFLKIDPNSYISLETVLGRCNVIKGMTPDVHCVSLTRSKAVGTKVGTIVYHRFSRKLFFGFNQGRIAYPEKAFLDYIYLRAATGKRLDPGIFNTELLNRGKIARYIEFYPKSTARAARLII